MLSPYRIHVTQTVAFHQTRKRRYAIFLCGFDKLRTAPYTISRRKHHLISVPFYPITWDKWCPRQIFFVEEGKKKEGLAAPPKQSH